MANVDYRHTARVSADSWFIRFYCWLWEADVEKVDFCRLFWGYVFALPNLLVRIVGYVPYKVLSAIGRALKRVGQRAVDNAPTLQDELRWRRERLERRAERREKRKNKYDCLLSLASRIADRLVEIAQAAWKVLRYPTYALVIVFGVVVVGGLGYLAYLLGALVVANAGIVAIVTAFLVGIVVTVVLTVSLVALGGYFFSETERGKSVVSGTKGGFLTFGGVLRKGVHAIKARTCPKIEVIE